MARKRLSTDDIVTRLADKLTASEENIKRFFGGGEDPHSSGTGEKGKAVDFVPKEFVKDFIETNSPDNLSEKDNLDPINWDYAAKRLLKILNSQLDRGGVGARFSSHEFRTRQENTFVVTVIQMENVDYKKYKGTTVRIADGCISLKSRVLKQTSAYPLTGVIENFTLLVGSYFVTQEWDTYGPVYVLLNNFGGIESLKSRLTRLVENPVKWEEVSEDVRSKLVTNLNAKLQSQPVPASTDWLHHLEGPQLNQFVQNGTLQICCKNLEFDENLYVHRWFSIMKTDLDEDTTYIVFNAEEKDTPKISKQIKGQAFFIDDIEDFSYLPIYRQVPVTRDIDCSAAVKHLKYLHEAEQRKGPHHVQLLKFDRFPQVLRVISDTLLLQQIPKIMVIVGPPGEGKSFVMQNIYNKCSLPVCHFTASQFLSKFSSSSIDDFTVEYVREVIINKLVATKFDRVVLDSIFETLKIVVLVDTGSIKEDSQLYKIVKVMVKAPNLSVVLTTRSSNVARDMRSLHDSYKSFQIMCLSHNDKLDLLCKKSFFASVHSKNILNTYEHKFAKMPTRIWTAVTEVYKQYLGKKEHNTPCAIPLNTTVAEIFDKFVELSYQSFIKETPEFDGNYDKYLESQMFDVVKQELPDFLPISHSLLHQDEVSAKCDQALIDCSSFKEYFFDKFTVQFLSGLTPCDEVKCHNTFAQFFIRRYLRPSKTENHLNDILGYRKFSTEFEFDFSQFTIVQVVMLCKYHPNISRLLLDSFLKLGQREKDEFDSWFSNEQLLKVNIAGILHFLHLKPQNNLTVNDILIILSAHLGYFKLFRYILSKHPEKVHMRDIKIRERQSFRSLLHLLMYHSRDNDQTTIKEFPSSAYS